MIARTRFPTWSVFAATTAVALTAAAAPSVSQSEVRFLAKGPAGLNIEGTGGSLVAAESEGKIRLGLAANSLKTGIDLRDTHLRKYLEADKYPTITIAVPRSGVNKPAEGAVTEGRVQGDVTMHGVTKAVPIQYKAARAGNTYLVQGLMSVDIRDFKIEVPCYLGVCVDPNVKVKVKFKLQDP